MSEKRKILIVDDDPDILSQMRVILEANNYIVYTCDNSREAFDIFEEVKPDAVASDLMMEEMDSGFMLTYKIKKTEHGKKIPVILLTSATYVTGYKFDAFTQEEKDWLKCDAVLNKPISVEELMKKIESFFETEK
jgi:CheY-like chemotaxis protein